MLPLAFCLSTGKIRRQYQEIVGTLHRETGHQWTVETLSFFFIYHHSLLTPLTMTLPLAFCPSTGKNTRQYQEIIGILNREITAQTGRQWAVQTLAFFDPLLSFAYSNDNGHCY